MGDNETEAAFYDSNEQDDHVHGHHGHGHGHGHGHDHSHEDTTLLSIYWTTVLGFCLLVVCVLGIIGNILASLVIARSDMRASTRYILLALTFFDSLLLLSYLATFILYAIFPYDGHHTHENVGWFYYLHTQFLYPICQTAYTGSVYAIVLVTLERYVAVCWPLLLNRVLTRRAALWAVVGLALFAMVANLPRWLELLPLHPVTWLDEDTGDTYVELEQLHHNDTYVLYYHGVFWITIMYGIPFILLAVFNFLIWKEVRATNVKRANMSTSKAEISVTRMLLTVIGVFVVCNAVNCVLVIVFVLLIGDHHAYNIGIFVAIPLIINSSVNIVIYCAKGKAFRSQFLKLVRPLTGCITCCKEMSRTFTVRSTRTGTATISGKVTASSESHSTSHTSGASTKSTVSNQSSSKRGPCPFPLKEFPAQAPYIVYIIKDPSTDSHGASVPGVLTRKQSDASGTSIPMKVDQGVQAHMSVYGTKDDPGGGERF